MITATATERTRHMAKTITKDLPVQVTAEERTRIMGDIAVRSYERANLEAKVADLKALIKTETGQVAEWSKVLREGKETRPVKCEERLIFETNTCQLVRLDTNEVVHEEPMTADQRQVQLIPEDGAPKRRLRSVKSPAVETKLADKPNDDGEFVPVPDTH